MPWSACRIVAPLRFLLATAMLTALLTRAVSGVVENVRATIIREKQSRIAQQYTLPSRAGCSVMSVHHSSLGRVAVNCGLTRSAGVLTRIRFGRRRGGSRQPVQAVLAHDRADQFEVDVHVVVSQQRGTDPPAPVGAAGALVDLGDRVGHDQPADLPVGHGPSAVILQQRSRQSRYPAGRSG